MINQGLSCTGESKIYECTCPVWREAKPTKAKRKTEKPARDNQHKEAPNKPNQTNNRPRQQNKPKPRKRGSHKHQPGQRTTGRADKTKQNKGAGEEGKRRPANKERADAREGSRGRREKAAQAKKAGACSFSGVLRGIWITRGRIPQCRSEGHMNNTHNMVLEGKGLHRAEAFVAMKRSDDRSQSATTRHAKGMTTGPLQIQPDIRREGPAEHWLDQKTPEDNQGEGREGETRRERAKPQAPKPPGQTKNETATTPKTPNSSNEREEPRSTMKRKPHEKRRGKGQPKQGHPRQARACTAERHGPKHTTQNNAQKN